MKHLQRRAGLLFCFALLLSAVAHAAPVATVRTAKGTVWRRAMGQGAFVPLKTRTGLFSGDVVGTGPGGKVALLFSDGASIRLNENSALEITPPQAGGKGGLFRAIKGELWARLRPGNTASTRTVALGVRGTEILLQVADGDGTTTLSVLEGQVEFFNEFGQVVVSTAQQSTARPGQAPTAPVTLQTPGLLVEWTLELDRAALPREKTFAGQTGDELFNKRDFAGALAAYQNAPPNDATRERLGWALLELDRLDEAEAQFKAMPTSIDALISLAWLELARARPAQAETFALRALAWIQSDEARVALGAAQLRGGKSASAVATLRAATSPLAQAWLAQALLAQNDAPGALQTAQAAAKAAPSSPTAQSSLALAAFFAGDAKTASRAAKIAASLSPDGVAAQLLLAQTLLARGDADQAAQTAARARELDPQNVTARYVLGLANAGRRDYSHAMRELREALRLAPDFLPAASALARVFNAMNRPRDAVALLEERLPRDARGEAEGALGEVLYEQARYAEAATRLRAALQKQPSSALLNDALARALIYDNHLTDAIAAARRAVQLAPTIGAYHATLGLAYDFSHLEAQAEREYRTALTFDPQNALALVQLARLQTGTDLRATESSFTQGFLYDPALSQRLLRGGIDTEITPTLGDNGWRGVDIQNRLNVEGKFHALSSLNLNRDGGERANSNRNFFNGETILTGVPRPDVNLYATLRRQDARGGLPGSLLAPDADDKSDFRYNEAQFAGRQRLRDGQNLWLGLRANSSRNDTVNPALNSFVDPISGLPVQRQRFDSAALVPEVRYDVLRGAPGRASVWTLGLARARTDLDRRRELRVPVGNGLGDARFGEDTRAWLAYGQYSGRLGERLSLTAQLRALRRNRAQQFVTAIPGQAPQLVALGAAEARLSPALLATFQAAPRTSLRLAYNQRVTDTTAATFAPTETLIVTQRAALPFGTPLRVNLTQVEIEHYAGNRGFAKLFAFRSTASNTVIGGTDLLGFGSGLPAPNAPFINLNRWQAVGAGARYEQQITRTLLAGAGFTLRRTRADGVDNAPYEPHHFSEIDLHYVSPRGHRAGLHVRRQGDFFADSPLVVGRPRMGSATFVDLFLAHEPSVRHEFFVHIRNVFDRPQLLFNGFPAAGRRIQAGYTRRF